MAEALINAGDLDKRVTLLSPVYNEHQDEIVDWTPVTTVWAAIASADAQLNEPTESGRSVAVKRIDVTMRYRADINATWRLALGSRIFEVLGMRNARELNVRLDVECREVD